MISEKRLKKHLSALVLGKPLTGAAIATFLAIAIYGLMIITNNVDAVRLPQGETPAEFYSTQMRDDLQKTFLTAIQRANKSILLMAYSLSDQKIIEALKEKAEQGIDVQVIVDAKATPAAKKLLGSKVHTLKRSPLGLMHLKILTTDGEDVWIGSANMTYDSERIHGNLVLGMDSPVLSAAITRKAAGMPGIREAVPMPVIPFQLAKQKGELWFLPDNPHALEKLASLIKSAKKTVRVAMFTWTHPRLTQEVIDAHKRGVDVQVAIDRRQGQGAGADVVRLLTQAGVPVSLSNGDGLLHYKTLIVDDETLVNGSANWTRSAFKNNDDCFVILTPLTEAQQIFLNKLWGVIKRESSPVHY